MFLSPCAGVVAAEVDDRDISERASTAIVESIFGAAIRVWAGDKKSEGVTRACDRYLQLLSVDTIRMLTEPHQTAALRASAQCLMWSVGRLTDDETDRDKTETMVVLPVTIWICEHGTDDLKSTVQTCSSPSKAAELKAAWEAVAGVDYDRNVSDVSDEAVIDAEGAARVQTRSR